MKSTAGCFFCVQRASQGVKTAIVREPSPESFSQMVCYMSCEHTASLYRKL